MRLVHLSDLHLGFRQYTRVTADGVNQREADVVDTTARAITRIIELAPEVIVVGGDVFHSVRPPNSAILSGFALFARLRAALPDALIVMIAGNHDVPRTSDAGCILQLFRQLGVQVVFNAPTRIDDAARDLSVLAVPYIPATIAEAHRAPRTFAPDPARRFNVLLLHDEVQGVMPLGAQEGDRLQDPLAPQALEAAPWSYIAVGHYHVYRQIPLVHRATGATIPCYYSGSLEYTSTNPWFDLQEEATRNGARFGDGKGFIEHNLATGTHRFHPIAPSRRLLDIPAIDGMGLGAPELNVRIADALHAVERDAPGAIDGAIVRLVVRNVPRHITRTLDYTPLKDVRKRALHFQLDMRKPELDAARAELGAAGRRATLKDRVEARLRARPIPAGLDRERLVALGVQYLVRAEETATATLPVAES